MWLFCDAQAIALKRRLWKKWLDDLLVFISLLLIVQNIIKNIIIAHEKRFLYK